MAVCGSRCVVITRLPADGPELQRRFRHRPLAKAHTLPLAPWAAGGVRREEGPGGGSNPVCSTARAIAPHAQGRRHGAPFPTQTRAWTRLSHTASDDS